MSVHSPAFFFLEKIADGRVAIAHRGPGDVAGWSMVAMRRGSQPQEVWPKIAPRDRASNS
jgi:hypothetical protein